MPGEGLTHGPRAVKKHGEGTTGSAESSGIPCAMALRLIPRSPRGPGFLAPVARELRKARELGTSVGVPGPHGFTVRDGLSRPRKKSALGPSRPPHPASTFVTTRNAPLGEAGRGEEIIKYRKTEAKCLCAEDWTGTRARAVICPSGTPVDAANSSREYKRYAGRRQESPDVVRPSGYAFVTTVKLA